MTKFMNVILSLVCGLVLSSAAFAATNAKVPSKQSVDEKFDVIEEDETDDTDPLAIPFDESEVEDEEQIDRMEGKPFKIEKKTSK